MKPNHQICILNYLALGYFNLVMSYIPFTGASREIALLTLPTLLYLCHKARYRLIPNLGVYYCYDNSSALLNDKSCALSYIDFYIFITYIAVHERQPYKSILMSDNLQDNPKPHDIVVLHLGSTCVVARIGVEPIIYCL